MIRRWFSLALVSLIPAAFVVAFLAMAWIRSRQGHSEQVYASKIEALAVHREPADPLADARNRGQKVYQHYCKTCHGESGKGDGFNSSNLARSPRDFTDAGFWDITSDERAYYAVTQGGTSVGKSVLMPAWGHTLTDKQVRDVIIFVRAFAAPPQAQQE